MRAELHTLKPIIIPWAVISIVFMIWFVGLMTQAISHDSKVRAMQTEQREYKKTVAAEKKKQLAIKTQQEKAARQAQAAKPKATAAIKTVVTSTAGNAYALGNCTWYSKKMRPDLPNNLGNANTWAIRARNQGIPTGPSPKVGAIGQRGMHVVYIESVNADSTVSFSEMNFIGYNKISHRTLPASSFTYIY